MFERFSDAKHLVVLEEDLYMSVDILDYFSQLIPVMEKDKSIYCISAWNDQVTQTILLNQTPTLPAWSLMV